VLVSREGFRKRRKAQGEPPGGELGSKGKSNQIEETGERVRRGCAHEQQPHARRLIVASVPWPDQVPRGQRGGDDVAVRMERLAEESPSRRGAPLRSCEPGHVAGQEGQVNQTQGQRR